MSQFMLGIQTLMAFTEQANTLKWSQAKLSAPLFKDAELPVYEFMAEFVGKFHKLPTTSLIFEKFPSLPTELPKEPPGYYLDQLEKRHAYTVINKANVASQSKLADNKEDIDGALTVLTEAMNTLKSMQYRTKLYEMGADGPTMLLSNYIQGSNPEGMCKFYWPYLDDAGGAIPGDIISIVGRPQAGKSFLSLYTSIGNWRAGKNVLFVSMEMAPLPIMQRVAAMYGGTNLTQLKQGAYATPTFKKFKESLLSMSHEDGNLYIVDGNLAADADSIYTLAAQLQCDMVYIDGAYLLKHPNVRLDRYTRVAENVELMKKYTSDIAIPTFASWQFNRGAVKDKKKGEHGTLDDIAYSDAIGQISSIILGLFQHDDTIEALTKRDVEVLKGRGGEIGTFPIHWDFDRMDFDQIIEDEQDKEDLGFI